MSYLVYCQLDVHVAASDEEVTRRLHDRLRPQFIGTPEEKKLTAAVLREHHEAGELYCDVVRGRL